MIEINVGACTWCNGGLTQGQGPKLREDWRRWHCRGCGAFGYIETPSASELTLLYRDAWKLRGPEEDYATGNTSGEVAESLLTAIKWSAGDGRCLDYGSGKGGFAARLKRLGARSVVAFDPYGDDPLIAGVQWHRSWTALAAEESFDWLFMIEVIEHLRDPLDVLRKLRQVMRPGSRLLITTPNSMGWRARLDGFAWREAQNPTHINLFSPAALHRCLRLAGFSCVSRVRRPVRYKAELLPTIALGATQMVGIDGGLRMVASGLRPDVAEAGP